MIKAILFDADGVLIHREKYFSILLQEEFNIPLTKSLTFFNGEFTDCLIGKKDLKNVLPKYLKEWGWEKSLEELIQFWFESEKQIDKELLLYIQKLKKKGIKVYIGTNNERYRTEYLREKTELGEVIHKIYGSGHIGYMKPDYKFFQHIITDQNLKKEEVLFWDDDKENVNAARNYGMHAELYTQFQDFEKKMAVYLK